MSISIDHPSVDELGVLNHHIIERQELLELLEANKSLMKSIRDCE